MNLDEETLNPAVSSGKDVDAVPPSEVIEGEQKVTDEETQQSEEESAKSWEPEVWGDSPVEGEWGSPRPEAERESSQPEAGSEAPRPEAEREATQPEAGSEVPRPEAEREPPQLEAESASPQPEVKWQSPQPEAEWESLQPEAEQELTHLSAFEAEETAEEHKLQDNFEGEAFAEEVLFEEAPASLREEIVQTSSENESSIFSSECWRNAAGHPPTPPGLSVPWFIGDDVSTKTIQGSYSLTEIFLLCMCYKHPDLKKKDLVLRGDELFKRIGRRINDLDVDAICRFLHNHPDVVGLDLSYNRVTKNGAKFLFYSLSFNRSVETLNLMDNNIDNIDVLLEVGEHFHFKSLRLNGNEFESKGGIVIAKMMECNRKLELLDIGQTDQDIYSLVHITNAFGHLGNPSLKVLDLSRLLGQCYYQPLTDHFARLIGQMLKFNTSLLELHLEKNCLTDHDLELMLWHGLEDNRTLQVINLSANHIGDHGLEILATYLDSTRDLKAIMLSKNMIRDTGARALSFRLPYSKVILLDLSYNRIGDQGMTDLLFTLKKPRPLMAFFFFGNLFKQPTMKVTVTTLDYQTIVDETCQLVHRLILLGELFNDSIDVVVYQVDDEFSCGLNAFANQYKRRYYCVPSTTWPRLFKLRRYRRQPPIQPDTLNFKYHNIVYKREPISEIPHSGLPPTKPVFKNSCYL